MCGISGIINKKNKKVAEQKIKSMNDLIVHRGPDDEGFMIEKNFALGHRRLSILDLTADGHQPMTYDNGSYTITYNGEVYNYLELRQELEKDYIFNTHTDTEVILASYAKWGQKCVEKFNGMWSFAIYDKKEEIIFCSRDRYGVKPFYYTEIDNKFIFGSEIKQLLTFHTANYLNKNILLDYLLYGLSEHTNETFFKNIYKLEQSHNLIYNLKTHKFIIQEYYQLQVDKALDKISESDSIQKVRNSLETAIELRLRSDVKVATCLSGGLDSSSISAIASKKYFEKTNQQFIAIHAKSIEKKTDESLFARNVASYCNLNMIEISPTLNDFTANVEEIIYTQEEPFSSPSIFMQYFVMKKAKELNCMVMLDGQGGDETLFGYEGYLYFYFASLLSKFKYIQYIQQIRSLTSIKTSKLKIIRTSFIVLLRNNLSWIEKLYRKRKYSLKIPYNTERLNHFFTFLNFKDFQKRELRYLNLPQLLRYEDKNSMRHSIEARLPFLDYQFVQNAVSLNDDLKFKESYLKYLLRKSVENILPEKIVWRRNKFGFEAPTDMWINSYKENMIVAIKNSKIINSTITLNHKIYNDHSMLWKIFNIAIWEKVYEVKFE